MGATDDTFKIIYYHTKKVIMYEGMKNFPYSIATEELSEDSHPGLWIGCLDGSVYYLKAE